MADQTVIRFDANGDPETGLQPWDPIPAEIVTSGDPVQRGHTYFSTANDRLTAGVWDCTAHDEAKGPYEVDEFMVLMEGSLDIENGEEIQMREILFAPGWTAPRHYHNSDLFIYVVSGSFEVDMEGEGLETYTTGQALRMRPNTPMDARNSSDKEPLKLAVFQVGSPDSAFVVPVETPNE